MTSKMILEGRSAQVDVGNKSTTIETDGNADELADLRRQNSVLKGLVLKALKGSLKLEDLPSELSNDREFVLAALENTVNWYALPQKWKDDCRIACFVFKSQRMTLPREGDAYIDVIAIDDEERVLFWKDLPFHLRMNEEVLLHALRTRGGPQWEETPLLFRKKVDLIATAVLYRKIRFDNVPLDLQQNHREIALHGVQYEHIKADGCPCFTLEFCREVIEDGRLKWSQLPVAFQNDLNFALSISRFASDKLALEMLSHVAELRLNTSFWAKLLISPEHSFWHLMERYLPAELCSNRDFMLEMCQGCTEAFSFVDAKLLRDRGFLELALEQNPAVLQFLSGESQKLHRDLVIKAITELGQTRAAGRLIDSTMTVYQVARAIEPSFWMKYDYAMAWLKAGHHFPAGTGTVTREVLNAWRNNRGLCLAEAIHGQSLYYVPECFTSDIPFMLEVVEHHPEMYWHATGAAREDLVIITTAFSGSAELVERKLSKLHLKGQDDEIQRYLDFLRSKLNLYRTFSACVLGNMLSNQSVEMTGTYLTLLNQGPETSVGHKKLLAEYLDIPTGKWLCCLKQAESNVREAIAPWAPNALYIL